VGSPHAATRSEVGLEFQKAPPVIENSIVGIENVCIRKKIVPNADRVTKLPPHHEAAK
jgi:hypothetical protein